MTEGAQLLSQWRPVAEVIRSIGVMRASRWQWHLDELFVRIHGRQQYLWRAADYEGEVLESFVTKTRDRKAPLKFLRKARRRHGRQEIIVTDDSSGDTPSRILASTGSSKTRCGGGSVFMHA